VAEALGFEDDERAPPEEMLAAAARIAAAVDAPVTVDAEAGYRMAPADLVDALFRVGAAGCNLEDTDHSTGTLVGADRQAERLRQVRRAATNRGYGLVINARVDVFLADYGANPREVLDEAVMRGRAYLEAGADCVYPIFLHDAGSIAAFVDGAQGPVNILALPQAPPTIELGNLGVARISYGSSIHRRTMDGLTAFLSNLAR